MLSLASALGAVAAGQARSQDPYEVLGLRRGASEDEIRRAYRQIAVKDHPDKKPGDASARERFLQAKEAYSILMDPNSNKRFDGHTQDDHSRESRRGRTKRATWESGESGTGLESGTVELNKHTLMALALKSGETWLVYVYAEGCMECASEIPAWEAAADALTGVARLGRISATAEPTVAGRLTNLHFLPSVIGFGPACTRLSCGVRLKGRITSKRLVEFASGLANLPLIRTLPSCPVDTWSILSSGVAPDRLATAAVHVPTGSNRPSAQVRASANSAPGVSVFACATENDSSVGRIDIARPDVERVVRAEVKSERHEIDRLLLAHGVELVPELHSNSALSKQLAAPGLSVLVVALSPNNGLQIADKLGDILVQVRTTHPSFVPSYVADFFNFPTFFLFVCFIPRSTGLPYPGSLTWRTAPPMLWRKLCTREGAVPFLNAGNDNDMNFFFFVPLMSLLPPCFMRAPVPCLQNCDCQGGSKTATAPRRDCWSWLL